ncbi:MAG: PLP-dependent transferase [Kiloniellales bacterium]
MDDAKALSPRSLAAQAGHFIDPATGAITPPVHPSTTFARDADYAPIGTTTYSRYHNPTYEQVERVAAELDEGAEALVFAAGMAAIAALFETVNTGQHMVAPTIMYHGAQDWLRRISEKRGIALSLFDAADPRALERAIRPGETAIVWIETPVNPTWDVIDIAAAAAAAHAAGAILAVDATVSTPVTTRPLDLGADLVFHSGTKYLNGHSDVTAGVLVTRQADARWQEIRLVRGLMGGVLGPFEAWLLLRGLRTLFVRFERASANALQIARHFEGHGKLEAVLYPGLESHPGHAIAKRQMTAGYSGMLSLLVKGDAEDAKGVATRTALFVPATSLGGVESLIEHRATIEGPRSQVPPNLLRLSIGIEDARDLIADLEQALAAV